MRLRQRTGNLCAVTFHFNSALATTVFKPITIQSPCMQCVERVCRGSVFPNFTKKVSVDNAKYRNTTRRVWRSAVFSRGRGARGLALGEAKHTTKTALQTQHIVFALNTVFISRRDDHCLCLVRGARRTSPPPPSPVATADVLPSPNPDSGSYREDRSF